jgi:hypothetical protein
LHVRARVFSCAADLGSDSKELLAQYGEEGRSATLEGLCATIHEFRNQWLEALESLTKLQEAKEKQAKKRAAKATLGTGVGAKAAQAGARAGGGGMPPGMGAMMGELGGALAARGTAK